MSPAVQPSQNHRVPRSFLGIVVGLILVLAVACTGSSEDGSAKVTIVPEADPASSALPKGLKPIPPDKWVDRTGKAEVLVNARDNKFVPQYVEVSAGTEVRFDNIGRTPHNVLPVTDGQFEPIATESLQAGDSAVIRLDEPGEYPYYCSLHGTKAKGMVGRILVTEAPAP